MMKFRENEEAVSPVIGVILMVAITVILAAVIAAFVFGMGSNVGTTKTVAISANQNGNDIILTYHGGADASTLNYLKITVKETEDMFCFMTGGDATTEAKFSKSAAKPTSTDINSSVQLPVGATVVFKEKGSAQRDHVVVVGYFMDGSEQVVLDTYV
jgi:flagellin-like protein